MKYGLLAACIITATTTVSTISNASNLFSLPSLSSFTKKNDYAKTKYPIVFSHGLTGFTRIGVESFGLDYWHQIIPDLKRNGADAWPTRVSPFNSNEVRGEQLLTQVEDILALTGAEKVNLIGHSQGGPTIRYVGTQIPQHVASLTTVAGVNKGSPMADFILLSEGTIIEKTIAAAANFLSGAIVWAQGLDPNSFPHDSLASAKSLSTAGSLAFNKNNPAGVPKTACGEGDYEVNGMKLFSFTGNQPLTNVLDPSDLAMSAASLIVSKEGKNDGLVPVCSARFGKTIRDDYQWNHLDEVNQILGVRGLFSADPVAVYRQHANRLKLLGL